MNTCYIFPRQTERVRHISSDHLVERRLGTSCFALRVGLFQNRISVLNASLPLYREVGWRSLKGIYPKKHYCLCCTYKVANRIKDRLICYEITMITYILFPFFFFFTFYFLRLTTEVSIRYQPQVKFRETSCLIRQIVISEMKREKKEKKWASTSINLFTLKEYG